MVSDSAKNDLDTGDFSESKEVSQDLDAFSSLRPDDVDDAIVADEVNPGMDDQMDGADATADADQHTVTANNGIRNLRQFWPEWMTKYPNTLSSENRMLIGQKRAPIVDAAWIKAFPEHAPYKGEILVHHHIDQGPLAIPLPLSVHKLKPGSSIWHPK